MAEIVWTAESLRWMETIHSYIAADNPDAANRVIDGIYEKVQMLSRQPLIGSRYLLVRNREVREISYGHYRIAYLVASEERVEILGIFHTALDLDHFLGE